MIGALEGNETFKARLVKHGDRVKEKLKNTHSQLIKQIKVNHDLIEVKNGWCLSLSQRKFIPQPIANEDVGKVTPRGYFEYDHTASPDAKYFQQILENSLSPDDIKSFCNDFLNLLHFQNKHHKEKASFLFENEVMPYQHIDLFSFSQQVPCLVGEANSGKTSLFAPILGVVTPSKIARVTKQKSFNKAMIDETTEIIFIDEATVGLMDIDDWKLLTQGGWTAHDRKFSTARGFVNRCPMLLTCQTDMEFPAEDQGAMDARISTYRFKALPDKDPKAFEWLKGHPVECIVWAMDQAGEQTIESSGTVND